MTSAAPLPCAHEAERAVLGAVLLEPRRLDDLRATPLRPDDFHAPAHGEVYAAMLALSAAGRPIDVITLDERLPRLTAQIVELSGAVATAQNVGYYARMVREKAIYRRLIAAAATLAEGAREQSLEPSSLIASTMRELQECESVSERPEHIGEVCERVVAEVDARARGELPPPGVPTGLQCLDETLTYEGLPRRHITVLGGATSSGKSALANTCVLGAAAASVGCLLVSLEDEAEVFVKRALARLTRLGNSGLQRGQVGPGDMDAFNRGVSELAARRVWFLPRGVRRADDIVAAVRRHVRETGCGLVVIDFLQLVGLDEQTRSTQERVDRVMSAFVDMSTSIDAATVVVSQLKRTGGAVPTKEDLYHSGAIEQWAHTIGLLWRAPIEGIPCVALVIDKAKNGPTGLQVLGWEPHLCAFRDARPEDETAYRLALEALKNKPGTNGRRDSRAG